MVKDGLVSIKKEIDYLENTVREIKTGEFSHRQLFGIFELMSNKLHALQNNIDCQIRYIDNVNSSEQTPDIKDDIPPF